MPYPRLTRLMPDERRPNPFDLVHKALRFGHCRMVSELGVLDFADGAARAPMLARLAGLLGLSGEVLALQAAAAADGGPALAAVAAALAGEQASQAAALAELSSLARALDVAAPQRRAAAGRHLYRCHGLFAAAELARMDMQETVLLGQLHAALGDGELCHLEARTFRGLAPRRMELLLQLMLPALPAPELDTVLARLRQILEAERFAALFSAAVQPLLAESSSAAA